MIGGLLQISVDIGQIKNKLVKEFDSMRDAARQQLEGIGENMDTLVKQQIIKVEEVFNKSLTQFGLSQANFEIWSRNTIIGDGDKGCWKSGFFSEREIKNNYDVRRPITDTILESIEENFGTMLYGRPYDGKTILLKRIMLEEIQKEEFVVLFCDKVIVNQVHIKNLLTQIEQQFPKLLVIIDNPHSSGAEEIYKAYNHFLGLYNNIHSDITNNTKKANADKKAISSSIRFLFAARAEEINQFTNSSLLNIDDKREVEYALSHINRPIEIHFNPEDASRFVQKALEIGNNEDQTLPLSYEIYPQKIIENIANTLFDRSNNDPLMFGCYIRSLISAVSNNKIKNFNVDDIINSITFVNCINEDFREKKTDSSSSEKCSQSPAIFN
jgi:hypothetical protein